MTAQHKYEYCKDISDVKRIRHSHYFHRSGYKWDYPMSTVESCDTGAWVYRMRPIRLAEYALAFTNY